MPIIIWGQAEIFEKKQFPNDQALNHEMRVASKRDGWKIKLINTFYLQDLIWIGQNK